MGKKWVSVVWTCWVTHYELRELEERCWELVGNTLRTTKFQNIQHHAAPPKGKKKKNWASWVHADSFHWLPRIYIWWWVRCDLDRPSREITSRVDARRPLLVRIYHILYFIELWMINGGVTGFRGYNNRLEINDVSMDDNCEYWLVVLTRVNKYVRDKKNFPFVWSRQRIYTGDGPMVKNPRTLFTAVKLWRPSFSSLMLLRLCRRSSNDGVFLLLLHRSSLSIFLL